VSSFLCTQKAIQCLKGFEYKQLCTEDNKTGKITGKIKAIKIKAIKL